MIRRVFSQTTRALTFSSNVNSRSRISPVYLQFAQPITLKWYSSESEINKVKEENKQVNKDDIKQKNNYDDCSGNGRGTEPKEVPAEKLEDKHDNTSSPSINDENPQENEIKTKNKEILMLKDRLLRSIAEFRNLQERTKREMKAARDFAIQQFAKDLIESVDNLDRALSIVPQEKLTPDETSDDRKNLISLYEGLKMTESVLMSTLKKHGLERFDPSIECEKFNPNEHEATFMTPVEGKDENTVFNTQQKGFKLNGRILRAAKVGVVKNS